MRYEFVQGLNKSHVEQLSYEDDMNRNKGEEGWRKARIDASNWQVLNDFRFVPDQAEVRIHRALPQTFALLLWLAVLLSAGIFASRRLKP